jgi:hypothetical protein
MTISDKTRKNLWAKSGNRCAICKIELFAKDDSENILNIGEECHIISSKKNGPRHKQGLSDYDSYDNLLLLCRNHHKEIDTLTEAYTEELLRYMKVNHEKWVRTTLDDSIQKNGELKPKFLSRITSGKELFNILSGVHGYRADYDEVSSKEESDYIGGVLQTLTDYGDLTGMGIEQFDKVQIGLQLNNLLKELESKGFFLFAEKNVENIQYENTKLENWSVATLLIKRKDNEEILNYK